MHASIRLLMIWDECDRDFERAVGKATTLDPTNSRSRSFTGMTVSLVQRWLDNVGLVDAARHVRLDCLSRWVHCRPKHAASVRIAWYQLLQPRLSDAGEGRATTRENT